VLTRNHDAFLFRRVCSLKKTRSTDAKPPGPFSPRGFRAESLESGHSHRLRTLRSLGDLELDSLILLKGTKTASLDLRMVDEYIFRAAVRGDKSEALLAVEPFHSSLCHTNFFSLFK
jgi:hypothetical protein